MFENIINALLGVGEFEAPVQTTWRNGFEPSWAASFFTAKSSKPATIHAEKSKTYFLA
jgi:hypothetical protein